MIRQYFKNAGVLAIAESLLRLRVLVVMPFLTRQFGAVDYGVWSQMSIIATAISPLIFLGTESAVVRFLPGLDIETQKRHFSAWLIYIFSAAVAFGLPLLVFRETVSFIFFGEGRQYVVFMPLATGLIFSSALLNTFRSWFLIQNNAKLYSGMNLVQSLLVTVAVIVVLLFRQAVYQLVIYMFLFDLLLIGCLFIYISLHFGWSRPDYSIIPDLLKFGLPLVPSGFALWGLNYVDRLFLVQATSLTDLGIYAVAYSLGGLIIPLLMRPFRAMFPNSAAELYNRGEYDLLQQLFKRSAGTAIALAVPAIIGLYFVAEPLLDIFAPPEFVSGAPLIPLIATGYLFLVSSSYFEVSLGLVHRQYFSTLAVVIALVVNIIMNLWLIPLYASLGAAIATSFAFFTQFAISYFFSQRNPILRPNYKFVAKVLLSASLMGVALFYLEIMLSHLDSSLISALLLSITGLVIYLVCLRVFNAITVEDVLIIKGVFREARFSKNI